MTIKRRSSINCLLLALGVVLPFVLYEIYLRSVGYLPLSVRTRSSIFKFPDAFSDDTVLGWKLNPGNHRFAPVSAEAHETTALILEAGNRTVGDGRTVGAEHAVEGANLAGLKRIAGKDGIQNSALSSKDVLFVGDSFTFGDGLNDEETYPWVFQQLSPTAKVFNYAVPGYGTCQVWLQLRNLVESGRFDGATIIYGMSEFHETRNLPDLRTAWSFAAVSSAGEYKAPSCNLDSSGELTSSPAIIFDNQFPFLGGTSSVGRRLVHIYYDLLDKAAAPMKRPLSMKLLSEINAMAQKHRQEFVVLLQRFEPAAMREYKAFLRQSGIAVVDGSHPKQDLPEMQIVGDGHPNARMNQYWGQLVANYQQRKIQFQ